MAELRIFYQHLPSIYPCAMVCSLFFEGEESQPGSLITCGLPRDIMRHPHMQRGRLQLCISICIKL